MTLELLETQPVSVHPFPSPKPCGRDASPSRPQGRDRVELLLAAGLIVALVMQAALLIAGWLAG